MQTCLLNTFLFPKEFADKLRNVPNNIQIEINLISILKYVQTENFKIENAFSIIFSGEKVGLNR